MPALSLPSPFGPLTLVANDTAITALHWYGGATDETPLLREAAAQLLAYFDHQLSRFELPLAPEGGALAQAVWAQMLAIPFGETREYGQIAKAIGAAAQPVGQACGANPIPVIIPCHRIVGAAGLGGFSAPGGVETKVGLLKHEGAYGLLI